MSMNADNKYCRALAQLRSKPTHELKEVGDQWRTPDLLFWGINAITNVSPLTIDRAKKLISESILVGVNAWLETLPFDSDDVKQDMSERLRTVAVESAKEYGINHSEFIATMESLDKAKWSNIRGIRAYVRDTQESKDKALNESRVWPLEVGLVFNQIEGADALPVSQQNKLKANINQLWLERMPTSEIITTAGGLFNSMQGAVNA